MAEPTKEKQTAEAPKPEEPKKPTYMELYRIRAQKHVVKR